MVTNIASSGTVRFVGAVGVRWNYEDSHHRTELGCDQLGCAVEWRITLGDDWLNWR